MGEDAVEALDEGGGVFERDAFHEQGLVEEQPCGVFGGCVLGAREEFFDDLVIGVDLEGGFGGGQILLPHGAEHLLHLERGLFFVGDDAGGAVGQADGGADVLDAVAEDGFELVEQRLEGLGLFGLGVVFEVLAGGGLVDGLELDVAVLVDAGEDDLVEVVVEDEDFDVFLLIDFEQR